MIKKIIISYLLLLCAGLPLSQPALGGIPRPPELNDYEVQNPPQPSLKDPFISGLLSWFMMGIRQIYCREYTKGSLFIAADLLDKASLILLISHINNKYTPQENEVIVNWKSFDTGTKTLIITYFTTSLGLRFYSVTDAIRSAHKYNDRFFSQKEKEGLSWAVSGSRLSLSYTIPFND